jgi:thioredoxin-related protein
MKIYKTLLIALLLVNTSLFAQKYSTINIGEQMPSQQTEIFDTNEKSRTLNNSLKNNGLLVVFTSNSCPFVVMWEDRYQLLEEKCRNSDIGMLYINSNQAKRNGDDSVEKMKNHSKEMGYTFPYLIDRNSEIANAFGAKTTPHTFLFDKGKKIGIQRSYR